MSVRRGGLVQKEPGEDVALSAALADADIQRGRADALAKMLKESEGRGRVSPDERAAYDAAQDHEAAAVVAQEEAEHRAEEWEARALLDETEIAHLRTLAAVLERHALPPLNPLNPQRLLDEAPVSDVRMPDWALPPAVLAASAGIGEGITAVREWSAGELDALRERVER